MNKVQLPLVKTPMNENFTIVRICLVEGRNLLDCKKRESMCYFKIKKPNLDTRREMWIIY